MEKPAFYGKHNRGMVDPPHVISQVTPMSVDVTHGSVIFGPFCIQDNLLHML